MTYRDLIIVIASISYTPSRSHGLRRLLRPIGRGPACDCRRAPGHSGTTANCS